MCVGMIQRNRLCNHTRNRYNTIDRWRHQIGNSVIVYRNNKEINNMWTIVLTQQREGNACRNKFSSHRCAHFTCFPRAMLKLSVYIAEHVHHHSLLDIHSSESLAVGHSQGASTGRHRPYISYTCYEGYYMRSNVVCGTVKAWYACCYPVNPLMA